MKTIIGLLICLLSVALGLYLGVWVMFVGGIIQIIKTVSSGDIQTGIIAWGIVKIVLAQFVGVLSAYILLIPGLVLLGFGNDYKRPWR